MCGEFCEMCGKVEALYACIVGCTNYECCAMCITRIQATVESAGYALHKYETALVY
jgi:hypothetical protein